MMRNFVLPPDDAVPLEVIFREFVHVFSREYYPDDEEIQKIAALEDLQERELATFVASFGVAQGSVERLFEEFTQALEHMAGALLILAHDERGVVRVRPTILLHAEPLPAMLGSLMIKRDRRDALARFDGAAIYLPANVAAEFRAKFNLPCDFEPLRLRLHPPDNPLAESAEIIASQGKGRPRRLRDEVAEEYWKRWPNGHEAHGVSWKAATREIGRAIGSPGLSDSTVKRALGKKL